MTKKTHMLLKFQRPVFDYVMPMEALMGFYFLFYSFIVSYFYFSSAEEVSLSSSSSSELCSFISRGSILFLGLLLGFSWFPFMFDA